MLLLCNDEADAAAAFERFRHVVGEYPFPQAGKITVSVGFTAIEVGDTPAAAFERADRAVYHAKHNGRDQVSNHAELMRQGIIEDDKRVSDVELVLSPHGRCRSAARAGAGIGSAVGSPLGSASAERSAGSAPGRRRPRAQSPTIRDTAPRDPNRASVFSRATSWSTIGSG